MNNLQLRLKTAAVSILVMPAGLLSACSASGDATGTAAPEAPSGAVVFSFEDYAVGSTPPDFTAALTGGGGAIRWEVQEAADAPSGDKVLAQLSDDKTNSRYPHLALESFSARDVDVSTRFKTISGEVDASGGLMFRYLDKDNYYVVRANSLEDNVVAYKTEKGKRSSIGVKGRVDAYGVDVSVPHEQWNSLRVIARRGLFEVFLNGQRLFEVQNDTFGEAGTVGLWTKADAVTQFDDLTVLSLDE